MSEQVVFEHSRAGRRAHAQSPAQAADFGKIPDALRRQDKPGLPELSELEVVRHYTRLSQQNFSIANGRSAEIISITSRGWALAC